jgi:hypothetical protein
MLSKSHKHGVYREHGQLPGQTSEQSPLSLDSAPPNPFKRKKEPRGEKVPPNNSDGTAKMKMMAYIEGLRKLGHTDEQIRTMLGLKE